VGRYFAIEINKSSYYATVFGKGEVVATQIEKKIQKLENYARFNEHQQLNNNISTLSLSNK